MIGFLTIRMGVGAMLAALSLGAAGCHRGHGLHGGDMHAPRPGPSASMNLQGDDAASWMADPHMHAFYDAARAAFAVGPANVDVPAFEAKSRAIFHDFAVSQKIDPAAMQDHLKAIPQQIVTIATEDPSVLESYDAFTLALFGPP